MKKLFSLLSVVFVLLFSVPSHAELRGDLYAGAITTNPAANAILADTGPIDYVTIYGGNGPGARVAYEFMVTSTVAAEFRIQVLNASSVVVRTMSVRVPANSTGHIKFSFAFDTPTGYSVRVIAPAAITGTVQANIFAGFFELM